MNDDDRRVKHIAVGINVSHESSRRECHRGLTGVYVQVDTNI